MARRYRFTVLGTVLGLAAMPVIIALVWGVLLAFGWALVFADSNGLEATFMPMSGIVALLVGLAVVLCLTYQGYRLDLKGKAGNRQVGEL